MSGPARLLLRFPWPPKELSSNARVHWRVQRKAVKQYRDLCGWTCLGHGLPQWSHDGARLVFAFHPPDRRRRDPHNMPTAMKPAIDAIAIAMGQDDGGFECVFPVRFERVVKGGCVMVDLFPREIENG